MREELAYIDLKLAERKLKSAPGRLEKSLANATRPGNKRSQIAYDSCLSECLRIAFLEYAVHEDLEKTRSFLIRAFEMGNHVFRLKGSYSYRRETRTPGKEMVVATITDYSMTNSQKGFKVMLIGLLCLDAKQTHAFSQLVEDPEEATYIGPDSEICTPADQQLAYAMKCFLEDDGPGTMELLKASFASAKDDFTKGQVALFMSLLVRNKDRFLQALRVLLGFHAKAAKRKANHIISTWYFCLPALAFAKLALAAGLVKEEDLKDQPFFPVAMLHGQS